MATVALDHAMLDMDAARKAFEAAAVRVSSELEKLQQSVTKANATRAALAAAERSADGTTTLLRSTRGG